MITKYWRTIGYVNICSCVQDHKIYSLKYWTYIRASEAQEKLKILWSKIWRKGQPEVNTLDQKKRTPLISWRLTSSDSVKIIRSRLHVRFVTFYSCLHQGYVYNFVFFWPRWNFSTTLNAPTLFSNVSEIPPYKEAEDLKKINKALLFYCVINLS